MAADKQHAALQTIFSFFLGAMVLALVGVGVYTFYPPPAQSTAWQNQLNSLQRQLDAIAQKAPQGTLPAADQARMTRLQTEIDALNLRMQTLMQAWATNTSIILVIFATVVMAISLFLGDQLRILANGLLLGGLFTMIYGVGWAAFGGNSSITRFMVIVFALAITIALGYAKFVWRSRPQIGAGPAAEVGAPAQALPADVEARLSALETRLGAAAHALGGDDASDEG